MNETLYERIISARKDEPIHDILASLNIDSYKYLLDLECDDELRDKIVRYVAYAYSYQSEYLRKTKVRSENKKLVCQKLKMELSNEVVDEVLKNKNKGVNKFITWWIQETQHPLFRRVITGMDLEDELLELARTGLQITITAATAKEINSEVKKIKSDQQIKTKSFTDSVLVRNHIDADIDVLDRAGYGAIEKIMKDELKGEILPTEKFYEYMRRTAKKNDKSQPKQNHPALQESRP